MSHHSYDSSFEFHKTESVFNLGFKVTFQI